MGDTLKTVLETLKANSDNATDLIQKVDNFYNNAWNKLVFIISIGFTVVGIIVPLFIQWLQKKSLKASEDLLKKEIGDKTKEIKDNISNELLGKIDEKFKVYDKEIKMTRALGKAKTFFAEGKYNLEKNEYKRALSDFINSSYSCLECEDYKTLQDVVKYILNNCLPNLSREEIDDLKVAKDGDLISLLDYLSEKDDRATFQTIIGEIRVKITKIPKTIKEKPDEESKQPV